MRIHVCTFVCILCMLLTDMYMYMYIQCKFLSPVVVQSIRSAPNHSTFILEEGEDVFPNIHIYM